MITNERAGTPAQLMTLFAERASSGDADGLLALYEADAVFEPQFGVVLRGLDEIRSALTELAALRPRIGYVGNPDVVIVDDIAVVSNTWTHDCRTPRRIDPP